MRHAVPLRSLLLSLQHRTDCNLSLSYLTADRYRGDLVGGVEHTARVSHACVFTREVGVRQQIESFL